MSLIIYPAVDWDSFVTVDDADAYITDLTINSSDWLALDASVKEVYLRISTRIIVDGIDQAMDPLPDPMPDCVAEATSLMANQDFIFGLSSDTDTNETGALKKQSVGSLSQEWYDVDNLSPGSVSRIPSIVYDCLIGIGYNPPSNLSGLVQATLGRS